MSSHTIPRVPRRARLSRGARLAILGTLVSTFLAAEIANAAAGTLEEIVITATRRPAPRLTTPLSIDRIGGDEVALVAATHYSAVLNRIPGVMIQRGSGEESLPAIRSPVLTGAGSCGAFLFLENDIPIRPVGFCNVNEMLEINTEQAAAIEVLRGTGSALYGSNSMHGTVNVLQPDPAELPSLGLGLDVGPSSYTRLKVAGSREGAVTSLGGAALYTHDGGWREHSGFDEGKLNAVLTTTKWASAPMRFDLSATHLDQDTAGFITGKDAYRDEELSRSNANPEAFRRARSLRLTGLIEPALDGPADLELRPYLRSSRMEFLQHFLLGKPLERNGQDSGGLITTLRWHTGEAWSATTGVDVELANSFLKETQDRPTTGGSAVANAIRPAGKHYDYTVRSGVAALYGQVEYRFLEHWRLGAGARAEYVHYDYDNRMLAGNTDDQGNPCPFGGCLYSRPADRKDSFFNVAPKLTASWDLRDGLSAYANLSRGFRPPEMTELYRLQRQQTAANLDSEQLDAAELGLKGTVADWRFALAGFDMRKSNVILRESNGYNVSNGRTTHRGVEYDLAWSALDTVDLSVSGTYARHQYDFSRAVDGGETIVKGNDVDTAPRKLQRLALGWHPGAGLSAEAEWLVVGDYWLDAANAHRYPGHELLNLRGTWAFAPGWTLGARLDNALDRAYADRADYAFGNYRYFPGRGRALFAELAWRAAERK